MAARSPLRDRHCRAVAIWTGTPRYTTITAGRRSSSPARRARRGHDTADVWHTGGTSRRGGPEHPPRRSGRVEDREGGRPSLVRRSSCDDRRLPARWPISARSSPLRCSSPGRRLPRPWRPDARTRRRSHRPLPAGWTLCTRRWSRGPGPERPCSAGSRLPSRTSGSSPGCWRPRSARPRSGIGHVPPASTTCGGRTGWAARSPVVPAPSARGGAQASPPHPSWPTALSGRSPRPSPALPRQPGGSSGATWRRPPRRRPGWPESRSTARAGRRGRCGGGRRARGPAGRGGVAALGPGFRRRAAA